MRRTKVFVAGFFDGLHPGHISFLTECAKYGDLYVSIGSDKNLITLKKTQPLFHENERKYMLDALSCVKESAISKGEIGAFSFLKYFNKVCPDIFITNTDASMLHQKKKLCQDNNVEYKELLSEKEKRMQPDGSKSYSSTLLRAHNNIPQRLDLVGFYDQVYLNSVIPGSVILVNINPLDLKERAGMSSSTRNTIHRVFGNRLPPHIPPEELAEIIFKVENSPEQEYISGVVDQLGICLPGINQLCFDNSYWPYEMNSITEDAHCEWLESFLYLKFLDSRPSGYDIFERGTNFNTEKISHHSSLGKAMWDCIEVKDTALCGHLLTQVHDSQKAMIPGYESPNASDAMKDLQGRHLGAKLMGAGGMGYALVATLNPDPDFLKLSIRCPSSYE